MNDTLLRSLVALVPGTALLAWSDSCLARQSSVGAHLQLIGSICLVVVVLTHVFEELSWFPSMGWGEPASLGHYLDLASAVVGVILLPFGYLLQRVGRFHG